MPNPTPLNPDALEAMSRVMNPPAWLMIDREPEDELVIMIKERELSMAEKLAAAYLAADKPEATRDQCIKLGSLIEKALRQCGISVTYAISGPSELGDVAWILLREYPTLAVAQPVVNSVEELDALPAGSLARSGGREFYKTSYIERPWILPYGVDRFGSSYLFKHSKVILLHRPEATDAVL